MFFFFVSLLCFSSRGSKFLEKDKETKKYSVSGERGGEGRGRKREGGGEGAT